MSQENNQLKRRVWAFTTDMAIVVISNYFFVHAFKRFVQTIFFHLPLHSQVFLFKKINFLSTVSVISLTFAYFALFYFLTNGQTMGKALFGLRITNKDQSEITLTQSMLRSTAYFFGFMSLYSLFALPYLRRDQRSLADIFSGSSVVDDTVNEQEAHTEFQLYLFEEENRESKNFDSQNAA